MGRKKNGQTQKNPIKADLLTSIQACVDNGNRLVEVAEWIGDYSAATVVALSILAQEEFAKAFLLRLVHDDALPWTNKIRNTITHHLSKQLLGLIIEWLALRQEQYLELLGDPLDGEFLSNDVVAVIEAFADMHVKERRSYPARAKHTDVEIITCGKRDQIKQDSLYLFWFGEFV